MTAKASWLTRDRPLLTGLVPAILVGAVVWALLDVSHWWLYAPALGGIVCGLIYISWTLSTIPWTNANDTKDHARKHAGRSRWGTETIVILACLASFIGVAHLLMAGRAYGTEKPLATGFGLTLVGVAWLTIHMVFSLRYAQLYYGQPDSPEGETGHLHHPIEYDGDAPAYLDFFYMGVTIGMAYGVSDTTTRSRSVRGVTIVHALLSYLFGVVILGMSINLVVLLGSTAEPLGPHL